MSEVKVDTDLTAMDWGIFAGLFALIVGSLYFAGFNINNVKTLVGIMTLTVLALLLWGMLTMHEKVADFIVKHQMLALVASVLVTGASAYAFFSIAAVKSMHS